MNNIVVQYDTHHVLTIKNSLKKVNHKLLKIETPHNQKHTSKQHRVNSARRTKNKSRKFKVNYERGKILLYHHQET